MRKSYTKLAVCVLRHICEANAHTPADAVTAYFHNVLFAGVIDRKLRSAPTFEHAYCQSEYFRVRCGVGEVLVIAHARYGRMRISRCVREHFGYVDCSVDVADVLHRHCSGRRSCSIRVVVDVVCVGLVEPCRSLMYLINTAQDVGFVGSCVFDGSVL